MLTESGPPSITAIIIIVGIALGGFALLSALVPVLRGVLGTAIKHPLGALIVVVVLAALFMFITGAS